ncbi:GPI mannosyltransferase 3 isoform X1 [Agrilus planipennis]|uniref:Mannosyltransferase n=1 Tax=Agrilus planipennis TaxID=224129 RepID=A0A1W4XBQ4_AGRPL|nr:GPI mannosyltransferase 3 isoform X1 [Agrilus planipennis]XP_018333455.1 GPI mannosyltransferase 3 isoform X1 [Agrilus planipennis]
MKQDAKVFLILIFIRLLSVYIVKTWFVPDEYWQSLEVAHRLVFNYGYLTWEWTLGIRSYVYPLLIAILYKILQVLSVDFPTAIVMGPRILQAVLSAYSDLCLYRWTNRKNWALFLIVFSWFWFYCASRTLINTFETCLTTIALTLFPWDEKNRGNYHGEITKPNCSVPGNYKFVFLVGILCVVRPTAAIQWFPLCVYHLYLSKESAFFIIWKQYIPIGSLVLLLSIAIDSVLHGSFIITSFEFLKFNIIKDIATFYGVHPWYWYLSSGLPTLLGIQIFPFILAVVHILRNRYIYPKELILLACIVFTVGVYSILPHKEFRFILPLLPIMLYINSNYLSQWSRKKDKKVIWLVVGTIFVSNLIPALYLSCVHQSGTIDVMLPLRNLALKNPKTSNFLFLMPCHSTPLYSHLHVNVSTRFLTCEPNLKKSVTYIDETENFYKNPNKWLRDEYPPKGPLPSHIVAFDVLVPFIKDILSRYNLIYKIFHTHVPIEEKIGTYVMIYELINF